MHKVQIQARFRDLDGLGHVNNSVYVTYLEIARTSWYFKEFPLATSEDFDFIIANVNVDYKKPILMTDKIEVQMWVSKIGNSSWTFSYKIWNPDNGDVFSKASTVQVCYDYKKGITKPINPKYTHQLQSLLQE